GCHDQVAVGSRKYLVGHDVRMCIADPFGHLARHQIVEGLISKNADRRIDKCRIYIATASGALALRQRRKDPDDRIDAGKNIRHRHPGARRFAFGGPGQVHEPAHALRHQVIARARRIGPVLPETGHGAVDQPRALVAQARIVEPELRETPDLEVLDQYIGSGRELAHDPPTMLTLEVEFDGTLAAVGRVKVCRAEVCAAFAGDKRWAPAAGVVARAATLYLDHVGPKIGQDLASPWSGQDTGKLQHTKTSQRPRHKSSFIPLISQLLWWPAGGFLSIPPGLHWGRGTMTATPGGSAAAIPEGAPDFLFRPARSYDAFEPGTISDATLRALYELMKWGPTTANSQPQRV